jgi:uncharacterized protein
MDALAIINKYYPEDNELKHILLTHSRSVADKALWIADRHPELNFDRVFLEEAALLHDIGVFLTDAPGIHCHGTHPYICHGYLGSQLLQKEGFPRHALVCERHTGAGLSLKSIEEQNLPVPHREMLPVSLEEQVICFADKFFSKTRLNEEKSMERALKSLAKFGEEGIARFNEWCVRFLQGWSLVLKNTLKNAEIIHIWRIMLNFAV